MTTREMTRELIECAKEIMADCKTKDAGMALSVAMRAVELAVHVNQNESAPAITVPKARIK